MSKVDFKSLQQSMGPSYLGVFFVAVVALGALAGFWLDQKTGLSPLFVCLGVAFGVFGGIREMLKALKESSPPPTGRAPEAGAGRPGATAASKPEGLPARESPGLEEPDSSVDPS